MAEQVHGARKTANQSELVQHMKGKTVTRNQNNQNASEGQQQHTPVVRITKKQSGLYAASAHYNMQVKDKDQSSGPIQNPTKLLKLKSPHAHSGKQGSQA